MRLSIILPNLRIGGAEKHFITLAEEFISLGIGVTFAPIRAEGELLQALPGGARVAQLLPEEAATMLRRLETPGMLRRFLRKNVIRFGVDVLFGVPARLRRLVEEEESEVVISSLWEADFIAGLALRKKRRGEPPRWIVVGETDFEVHVFRKPARRFAFALLGRGYRYADAFVAPSSRIYHQLRNLARSDEIPVRIIPNAVKVKQICALAEEAIPASHERPLIVAVGRLIPEKGFDLLLKAFVRVIEAFPRAKLVILGDGILKGYLQALTKELGLEGAVSFPGFTLNPYPWMKRADVVVVPSRWETFGNVVVEAMALGVPVIATRSGGPEDVVEDGEDGILIPVNDVEALAQTLISLLADEERRRRISRRAIEKARRFSPEMVAEEYLALFRSIGAHLDVKAWPSPPTLRRRKPSLSSPGRGRRLTPP